MSDVNRITLCKDNYQDEVDFELAIMDTIMILMKNDYIMTVRYDEKSLGIVCIDYDHSNQSYGGLYPYWLSPEQFEKAID